MGCMKSLNPLPIEVEALLKEVALKGDEIANTFLIEANKIKNERKDLLKERHEKVSEADKNDIEKLNKLLLEYNKKEIENEKELIANEVDKMHSIYEMGLELAEKLKKITVDQLKKKLNDTPEIGRAALNSQINEVNKYTPKEFLNSKFGKPLKNALDKQGLREEYLNEFIQVLEEERKMRRASERNEFGISNNEFPPEDELNFTVKDLFEAIFDEYKGEFKSEIKKKILDKVL
jgi:hypothetical protein